MQSTKTITVENQKVVITLTGTGGTANVTGIGGLTKLATFTDDLTTSAANFVTSHAAAYLAVGIVLTSSATTLIFTRSTSNTGFGSAMITNTGTGNLSGAVVITSAKYYVGSANRIGILIRRASHTAGTSAFALKASLDSEDTTTPTMTSFNLLLDNVTSAIDKTLTRVNGKTLSANGDAFLLVDPVAIVNWLELTITNTTDGASSAYILLEN